MKIIDEGLFENFKENAELKDVNTSERDLLASFASISPFICRWLLKLNPFEILRTYKSFETQPLFEQLKHLSEIEDERLFAKKIRFLKYSELIKIAIRDVNEINPVSRTLEELTVLADLIIAACCAYVERRFSRDCPPLSVIAMGKLGACELNFSSDVDLIYVYGDSDIDRVETHNKKAVQLNRLLTTMTEDGFLYRVDNDLRPGGRFSPLAMSGEAVTNHYLVFGETWQRIAWLRARFLAGDESFVSDLLKELMPFVFSKYLDFSLIDDLRRLKEKIDSESRARDREGINIKLGKGGIREAEFFVQVLQVINGGRDISLRKVKFSDTVDALSARGLLDVKDGAELKDAYYFMRRLENSVQMDEERQEYLLPNDEKTFLRTLKRCGFDNTKEFAEKLDYYRNVIKRHFDLLFGEKIKVSADAINKGSFVKEMISCVGDVGEDKVAILERLYDLHEGVPAKYREAFSKFLYAAVLETMKRPNWEKMLTLMEDFVALLAKRSVYLPLFAENPQIIGEIIDVFSLGEFFSRILLVHPESLDFFIMKKDDINRETVEGYSDLIRQIVSGVSEFEDKMFLMRQFKNSEWLKIALLNASQEIDYRKMELMLTNLAEALLIVTVDLCREKLIEKYGDIKQDYAVIGLGKLGTKEMNFHSDLDLIFVYRSDDERAAYFNTKLMQRVITALTVSTKEGYLYMVDMRLRPTGSQGPLVTSFDNFVTYHRESSWLYEKQALTKARVLGERSEFAEELRRTIDTIVYEHGYEKEFVKKEIKKMRKKMEQDLGKQSSDYDIEIKTGKGGLVDIEFIVQYLKLCYGKNIKSLRIENTEEFFEALKKENILRQELIFNLMKAYSFLKRLETNLRIYSGFSRNILSTKDAVADDVIFAMGYDKKEKARFIKDVKNITKDVRIIFDEIFS